MRLLLLYLTKSQLVHRAIDLHRFDQMLDRLFVVQQIPRSLIPDRRQTSESSFEFGERHPLRVPNFVQPNRVQKLQPAELLPQKGDVQQRIFAFGPFGDDAEPGLMMRQETMDEMRPRRSFNHID